MDEFRSSKKSAEKAKAETDEEQKAATAVLTTSSSTTTNKEITNDNQDDLPNSSQTSGTTNKKPARRRRLARRRQYAKSRRVASSFLRSQFVRYDILSRKFHDEDETFDDWYKVQTIADAQPSRTTTNESGSLEKDPTHEPNTDQIEFGRRNLQLNYYAQLDQSIIKEGIGQVDGGYSLQSDQQQQQQQQQILSAQSHLERLYKPDEIDLNSEQDDSSKSSLKILNRSPVDPSATNTQNAYQRHLSGNVYFANYNSSSLDSSYSMATDENNNLTDPLMLSPRQPRTSPLASIPNLSPNYVANFETNDDVRNIISAHFQRQQQKQHKNPPQSSRRQPPIPTTKNQHLTEETNPSKLPIERVVRSETIDLNQVAWRPESPRSKKFFPSTSFNLRNRQQLSQFDLSNVGPKVVSVNRFVSMQRLDDQESSRQKHRLREETQEVSFFPLRVSIFLFISTILSFHTLPILRDIYQKRKTNFL